MHTVCLLLDLASLGQLTSVYSVAVRKTCLDCVMKEKSLFEHHIGHEAISHLLRHHFIFSSHMSTVLK